MSIIRGVNRRNSIEHTHKQPDPIPHKPTRTTPSQTQWDQMLQEMKSLMKENTRLKHQNLQLKEQIMLAKIELQNVRLHNQENILKLQQKIPNQKHLRKKSEGKATPTLCKMLKVDESTNTLLKFQSEDFTVSSSLAKQNDFRQWPSKESFDHPDSISFHDKEKKTPRCQLFNSDTAQLRKKSSTISTKMSKKEQIMNKYRKFLDQTGCQYEFTINVSRNL